MTMLNSAEFYGADRINEKIIGKHAGSTMQVSLKVGAVGDLNTGHIELTAAADHLRATVDESQAAGPRLHRRGHSSAPGPENTHRGGDEGLQRADRGRCAHTSADAGLLPIATQPLNDATRH